MREAHFISPMIPTLILSYLNQSMVHNHDPSCLSYLNQSMLVILILIWLGGYLHVFRRETSQRASVR